MRQAGRNVIAAGGILVILLALVPACPYVEAVGSAEAHDCCAPPLGVRAANETCCRSLMDAFLVIGVPSFPMTLTLILACGLPSPEPLESGPAVASVPRPARSSAVILRI